MPVSRVLMSPAIIELASNLKQSQQTVSVAESASAGLISAALLAAPGASAYFGGGSVIYSLKSRKILLGMRSQDVAGLAPMTEAMAMRFAQKTRQHLKTTWAVAELGAAGPTGVSYGYPAGTSVIAVDGPNPCSVTINTNSNIREDNMWAFMQAAIDLLTEAIG